MTWAWGEFHDEMVMMMMLRRRMRVILKTCTHHLVMIYWVKICLYNFCFEI